MDCCQAGLQLLVGYVAHICAACDAREGICATLLLSELQCLDLQGCKTGHANKPRACLLVLRACQLPIPITLCYVYVAAWSADAGATPLYQPL